MINRPRTVPSPTVSQFQLIGGIRRDSGDCLVAVEPGGSIQTRKGALYVVTEPAGDPAVGGDACSLAQATLAHEYYSDTSPSVTTSLTTALNKANNALIHYNRQVLAAGDVPAGLPRKIRVGLSGAVVRPGQVYMCQLRPGLILLVHQGAVNAYPRPRAWTPGGGPTPNGDGEPVGSFYPAQPLGTGPLVEADFAFRRVDPGDLLILCSSTLAPLLDEDALTAALPGRSAPEAVEYLCDLAQRAGVPEAHALAVTVSATPVARRTETGTLPPPPAWAPDPMPGLAPAPPPPEDHPIPVPVPVAGESVRLRPTAPRAGTLPLPGTAAPAEPYPAPEESTRRPTTPLLSAGQEPTLAGEAPPGLATGDDGTGADPRRTPLDSFMGGARAFGRRAAPVVGTAGKATLQAAGTAGKATLGAAGTAGRATLGVAGSVLGQTLPENVRQRGPAGMLSPDGEMVVEEDVDEEEESDEAEVEEPHADNRVVDFDAPAHAPARPPAPFPWLRWLVPIAAVAVLAVLLFAVQQVLAGQQTAKVDALVVQAQAAESASRDGSPATQRDGLLNAQELLKQALAIDPRSNGASRLATQVQDELDGLNGVTRITDLRLLLDFDRTPLPPAGAVTTTAVPVTPTAETALGGVTGVLTDTPIAAAVLTDTPALATPTPVVRKPDDYLSQVIVHGDDAFLLDKGSSRVFRVAISTTRVTPLLAPGDRVDLVGTNGEKARVGALLFLTWRPTADGGDLAVLDDAYVIYIWTPSTQQWQAYALGGATKLGRPRDLGAYDGNLYLLWAKPGQVSKWTAGGYNNAPFDWLSVGASNEISRRLPVAMAIDGDIQLLLNDGRIITLGANEIKKTIALPVWPQVASPTSIFSNDTTQSLYVVEVADKRIIRVDKATGAVQGQLKAPADSPAFDNLRNVYVDEAARKMYVLSGKRVYVAGLPALPTAPGTPAPALPAANPSPTPAAARTP